MSRYYCYAITAATDGIGDIIEGIEGEAVMPLQAGDHTVFASPTSLDDIPPRRRFLKVHTTVLEALGERLNLLPMRFGTIADDAPSASAAVTQARDRISGLLARYAGCREWGVRIETEESALVCRAIGANPSLKAFHGRMVAGGVSTKGQIELGRRVADALEETRRAEQKRLLLALADIVKNRVLRAPEHPSMLLKADLLIARCDEAVLIDRMAALSTEPSITGKLIGPAPLYSFVDLQLDLAQPRAA